jgi:AraC-like DNA-binding protein
VEPIDEAVVAQPGGALRGLVHEHHGYRQRGLAPARHLGLPSPFLTVILTLDEPLHLAQHVDPRRRAGRYETLVGGLHDRPAVIEHDGAQSGIQLRVSPLAARSLLGCPAGELAGFDEAAEDVLGPVVTELLDRFRSAAAWSGRFAAVDDVLGRIARPGCDVPPEVVHAWRLLHRSRGRLTVRDVARRVGWSERHLGQRFGEEIGLTPKTAAQVIRFQHARERLQGNVRQGRPDIAGVAAAAGYFDQAHLVRDWRRFTGLPPTEWIAHEFRNFQAVPHPLATASTA